MKKIGIIFGMEDTFPGAVVARINEMKAAGVAAEFVKIGGIKMAEPSGYRVIIDRISHDIAFYRAYLKNAVLRGVMGNILQDEKIPGVHIAFGDPLGAYTGPTWTSTTHIDVVGTRFDVWVDDGQLMRQGEFLF